MSNHSSFSWEVFKKAPIVGIIRGLPEEIIFQIAEAYRQAELYALEITMNTTGATDRIAQLNKAYPDLCIGAGTVCTLSDLSEAVRAGAQFIVTPILDREVIAESVELGIPIFPGAYTPTEIFKAWFWGATAVKVFPATQLGAGYIKDILAPLDGIRLLPTGGVSAENIGEFFRAGAAGVGMGSSLFDKTLIRNGDFAGLQIHFGRIKNQIPDLQ